MILVDTNILLRLVLNDNPTLSPKARIIFERISSGEVDSLITLLTISEVVYTLERSYKIPKREIVESLSKLFNILNLKVEKQKLIQRTFTIYVSKNISFPDSYHVAYMESKRLNQIYSFDTDFDKFPKIKRLEK